MQSISNAHHCWTPFTSSAMRASVWEPLVWGVENVTYRNIYQPQNPTNVQEINLIKKQLQNKGTSL